MPTSCICVRLVRGTCVGLRWLTTLFLRQTGAEAERLQYLPEGFEAVGGLRFGAGPGVVLIAAVVLLGVVSAAPAVPIAARDVRHLRPSPSRLPCNRAH